MKKDSIVGFFAALSTGALLAVVLRSPQMATSQGIPTPYKPPKVTSLALPPALAERRQEQLRNFLETHEVKDAKTQEVLRLYFGKLQEARAEVFGANRALLATLRGPLKEGASGQKSATDAQVEDAVKTYQAAVKNYEAARAEGEKDLAKSLGKDWTPRMRALLLGMGAIGEPSPIIPVRGASKPPSPATQIAKSPAKETIQQRSRNQMNGRNRQQEANSSSTSPSSQPVKAN